MKENYIMTVLKTMAEKIRSLEDEIYFKNLKIESLKERLKEKTDEKHND